MNRILFCIVISLAPVVSRADSPANGDSGDFISGVKISADGRYVSFSSTATDLTAGTPNVKRRLFLVDRTGPKRVTVIDEDVDRMCLSPDGSTVAYRKTTPLPRQMYMKQLTAPPKPPLNLRTRP